MGRERKRFERGFHSPGKDEISKSQLTDEEKVLNLEQPGWLIKAGLSHSVRFYVQTETILGVWD